jgi:serine/threonine-protein kinase
MSDQTTRMGKYEVRKELGSGGFATVYLAIDTTLGREVALKVLHPQHLMDSNFVQRFYQEARTIAALRHPNIVTVYEIGEAAGRLFIAMELADGGTLEGKISDKGAMPWAESLSLLRLIASALDYAHSQGVVHRDLKPANVLLGADSQPKLTDFGFARLLGGSNMTMASIASTIVGTPGYIAPEVWDANAATPAADIYALGCIAYELLTGIQLFIGATPVQALTAHVKGPQFPSQWPAGVPAGIERVLSKALAKEPDARHATGMALWEDLQSLSTPAPATAAAPAVASAAKAASKAAPAKAAPAAAPKAAPPVEEAKPAKGKPWLIPAIGGAVVVVILAIAGVVFGIGGGKGATPTAAPVAAATGAAAPTVNHTATAAAVSGAIATARAEGHQSAAQTIVAQATVTEAAASSKGTSTAAAAPTATPKGATAATPTATPKGATAAAPTATPKAAVAAPTAAQATKGPSPTAGKLPTSTTVAATATVVPTVAAQGGAILASGRSGAIFTGTVTQGDPKDTSQKGTCIQGSVKPSGGGLFTHFFVQADQGGKTVPVEQYFYDSGNFKLCGLGAGEWGVAVYEYNKIPTSGQEQAAHQVRFRAAGTPGEIFYIKFVGKVDLPAATATPEAAPANTETPTP